MRRLLTVLVAVVAALAVVVAAGAGTTAASGSKQELTIAVIGDAPYGPERFLTFPNIIESVNADSDVELAVHLGDIKSGSTRCDDSYFEAIADYFEDFDDPLVFTPGDNEWTDCHRVNNGAYVPTERLAKLREVFFPRPGRTLGDSERVRTQADERGYETFVENQLWVESKVVFSAVHVVGSNNGLAPWSGIGDPTPALREAEVVERTAAALAWLDTTFDRAERRDAHGVVIVMQADMWDGPAEGLTGFRPIVQRLADRASAFGEPVLLIEGDSHAYLVDQPLAAGSPLHGVTTAAPNLTRIVVQGSADFPDAWLRLTVRPREAELFSWETIEP
jgi:Calcineurin-like phosphoesterase